MAPRSVVDGCKPCSCPLHKGEMIPVSRFRKRTRKATGVVYYESRCRAWQSLRSSGNVKNRRKTDLRRSGLVPIDRQVMAVIEEIISRVGKKQAAREIGMGYSNFYKILIKKTKRVNAETYARLIAARDRLRSGNVVLHKKSIRRGSLTRGEKIRRPVSTSDYYNQHDNGDVEKRILRRNGRYMFKDRFLCGCDPKEVVPQIPDPDFRFDPNEHSESDISLIKQPTFDSEWFEVCPIHKQRMYGWRSRMRRGPQGNEVYDDKLLYLKTYGPRPDEKITSQFEDCRDNRDPTVVGNTIIEATDRATRDRVTDLSLSSNGKKV